MYVFRKFSELFIERRNTFKPKKFPNGKKDTAKKSHFYVLQAPTQHSFIFVLQFFYELKQKAPIFKMCLRFPVSFLLKFTFLLNKKQRL